MRGMSRYVSSGSKYRDYLKESLLNAKVSRPSGTYTGHYDTGALYNSIKDFYIQKALSNRRFKLSIKDRMNEYGYKLSDGYIANAFPYEKLLAWATRKGVGEHTPKIMNVLSKRPYRQGSMWIDNAQEAYLNKAQVEVANQMPLEVHFAVDRYIDDALTTIFLDKRKYVRKLSI